MVTDYKKPTARPRNRKTAKSSGRRSSFFAGVATGALLTLLVFNFDPITGWLSARVANYPTAPGGQVMGEPENPSPKFEFYSILPEMEVPVREPDLPRNQTPNRSADTPITDPGSYILQAGSFTRIADADRLKATLTLLGTDANIVPVNVDGTVWHRVRIGPFSDLERLNQIRTRLAENNIPVLLLRLRS